MRAIELTKLRGEVKAKSSLSARGTIPKAPSRDFQSAGITAKETLTTGTKEERQALPRWLKEYVHSNVITNVLTAVPVNKIL